MRDWFWYFVAGWFLVIGFVIWFGALWKKRRPHFSKPCCPHEKLGSRFWTQDGWVRVCRYCKKWHYFGDDFNG